MKAYIAGRITGNQNYRAEFKRAQDELERQGCKVLNPAILPEGMEPADYMRICIAMIDSADIVAFLPGWEESRGARLERAWCDYVGKLAVVLTPERPCQPMERKKEETTYDTETCC